jgi:hypothetical protein
MDLAYKLKRLWAFCFMARPRIYESVEEMDQAIESYFMIYGLGTTTPATITGLALYLGFESRQSFYDYEGKEGFSYTIKRARLRIENEYEIKLSGNSVAGSIFALKNLGWKDKIEQDLNHNGGVQIVMNKVESVKPSYETKAE